MNFIKKIFNGENDGLVHFQFQKLSKGEFRNRALISAKKSGGKYSISTTHEFSNEMVKILAEKLGDSKTKVTGAIVSTSNLKGEIDFKNIKQFQGVKRYLIDNEMSGNEIISLLEKIPKAFFALSLSTPDNSHILKIKPKAPKSGSPGKNAEEPLKPNFCKIITTDKRIAEDFVFDVPDFKKADINHTFIINEIIISEELKKTNDYEKMREESKRKGIVVRQTNIDGKKGKEEKEFEA